VCRAVVTRLSVAACQRPIVSLGFGAVRAAGEAEGTVMETGVAEKHTGYDGVETDTESRPTIVDEIRSVITSVHAPSPAHTVRSN
jgi:hypothetical protein